MNLVPDWSLFAIIVIFLATYLVVRKFFIEPVNAILEARAHETRTSDDLYQSSLARFQEGTARMEAQLHEAKKAAAQLRDKFRQEAAAHRASVLERTSAQAKQTVAEADGRLSQDVAEARQKIQQNAESLARLAAERILGRAV